MRCGLLFVGLVIMSLIYGVVGLREAIAYREPKKMSCAEFTKAPPSAGWYDLAGCTVFVPEMSYKTSKSSTSKSHEHADEVMLPVHGKSLDETDDKESITTIVKTSAPDVMAPAHEMMDIDDNDEAGIKSYVEKNAQKLMIHRNIKGMVISGISSDSDIRKQLRDADSTIAPDFVMITEGEEPSLMKSLGMLLLSVVMVFAAVVYFRRPSRS